MDRTRILSRQAIVAFLKNRQNGTANLKDMMRGLNLPLEQKTQLRQLMRDLEKEGAVDFLPKKQFALRRKIELVEGVVRRNPKGYGWLETDVKSSEGLFMPPREMAKLVDGDRVSCRLEPSPKGPVAIVEKVLTRSKKTLIGTFRRKGRHEYVEVDGAILAAPIVISPKQHKETKKIIPGSVVEVEITHYPNAQQDAMGKIVRELGSRGDFSTELESVLSNAKVEREFSVEGEQQALTYGENPSAKDMASRRDLTALPLCTIDGETAKDFDDAVAAERHEDGIWVTVAIADVSHYVWPGSPIDIDAQKRATSLYYPGHCIPMIPEALSNGLCSLKPRVPRLCMTVEMLVAKSGAVKKTRFDEAVMNSHARLTYKQVQEFVDGGFKAMREIPQAVGDSIQILYEASRALRKARTRRGAVDFDAVESAVVLDDDGIPVSIHPTQRLEAHRVIEDLMVAANEAVARHLEERGWSTIYRIHEPPQPEKLKLFLKLAQSVGALTPAQVRELEIDSTDAKPLAKLMASLKNHPARVALDTLMLRSMMQARYSAHNVGHFGLASKSYLHFTSPIRRYPDLVAHRVLREWLKNKKKKISKKVKEAGDEELDAVAIHCSDRERKATDVERQMDALHACWVMRDQIGEEDEGVVTSCVEFGLFIRLTKFHVEGLLHVANLGVGHFDFDASRMKLTDKKTGKSFGIGDRLRVVVSSVSLEKRHIDLKLLTTKV